MIILQTKGIINEGGEITLNSMKNIRWHDITDLALPELPSGTSIDLSLSFDENILLTGINGIVWATLDLRQSEIIYDTLLAQHINSEINKIELAGQNLFLVKILNLNDIKEAIDFIWKSNVGLRLKPDWSYPVGESNKSFEQWLSGH